MLTLGLESEMFVNSVYRRMVLWYFVPFTAPRNVNYMLQDGVK